MVSTSPAAAGRRRALLASLLLAYTPQTVGQISIPLRIDDKVASLEWSPQLGASPADTLAAFCSSNRLAGSDCESLKAVFQGLLPQGESWQPAKAPAAPAVDAKDDMLAAVRAAREKALSGGGIGGGNRGGGGGGGGAGAASTSGSGSVGVTLDAGLLGGPRRQLQEPEEPPRATTTVDPVNFDRAARSEIMLHKLIQIDPTLHHTSLSTLQVVIGIADKDGQLVQHEVRVGPGQSPAEAAAEFGAKFSLPLDAIRSITAALAQTQTATGVDTATPRPDAPQAAAATAASTTASTAGVAPAIEDFGGADSPPGARVAAAGNTGSARAGLGSTVGGVAGDSGAHVAPSSSWGSVSVSEKGMRLDAAPEAEAEAGAGAGAGAGGMAERGAATSAPASTRRKSGALYLNLDVGSVPKDGSGDDGTAAGVGEGVDGTNAGEADPEMLALLQHVVIELDSDAGDQVHVGILSLKFYQISTVRFYFRTV